ncbi:hypothetical protein [Agathobacter rectalis]|nr:hypothetical protein [Agathobacter rectalis]
MDKNTAVRTATIDECITLLSFVLQETEEIFKAEYDESYDFEGAEKLCHEAYCEGLTDAIQKISKLKHKNI